MYKIYSKCTGFFCMDDGKNEIYVRPLVEWNSFYDFKYPDRFCCCRFSSLKQNNIKMQSILCVFSTLASQPAYRFAWIATNESLVTMNLPLLLRFIYPNYFCKNATTRTDKHTHTLSPSFFCLFVCSFVVFFSLHTHRLIREFLAVNLFPSLWFVTPDIVRPSTVFSK